MLSATLQSSREASAIYPSPVGDLRLTCSDQSLTGIYFLGEFNPDTFGHTQASPNQRHAVDDFAVLAEVMQQLDEYFAGRRQGFQLRELALKPEGTAFQKRVWQELLRIPYGTCISYGELARRIGQPKASRAVGLANGRNPMSILIPCHRVIGSSGKLVGYGGGLRRKQFLLELESPAKYELE